jgi:hypothetical protein
LARLIADEHATNSATTMTVIVLPNTAVWGKCRARAVEQDAAHCAFEQARLVQLTAALDMLMPLSFALCCCDIVLESAATRSMPRITRSSGSKRLPSSTT